jgi:phosphatidate cytidylyltransferase
MGVVGIGAILLGGVWFQMLVIFVTAVMVWECWIMIRGASPVSGMLVAAGVASVMAAQVFDGPETREFLPLFLVAPLVGACVLPRERLTFAVFALAIQVAGWGLAHLRLDYGMTWLLWLVGLVVVTDIAGYFAGKALGGPKFWPAVSPKKTWAGTLAGWAAAAGVGAGVAALTPAGPGIVALSVLLSFAGQMGDILESAFKRRQGVKDSSALIPGHGGLFDRFDALLGAALALLLVAGLAGLPGGPS